MRKASSTTLTEKNTHHHHINAIHICIHFTWKIEFPQNSVIAGQQNNNKSKTEPSSNRKSYKQTNKQTYTFTHTK